MQKSILVLAAVAAVATLAQAPAAEAGGLRIGFGFGSRIGLFDSSILRRAAEANERVQAREREVVYGRRITVTSKPSMSREQAAMAREARRQEAAAAAAAKLEAANARKKNVAIVTPPIAPALAPVVVAAPEVVTTAAVVSGDRRLDAAQQQQKVKADEVLKSLVNPAAPVAPATASVTTPAAMAAPAREASAGECLRFIPGAGVTVKVSCSE